MRLIDADALKAKVMTEVPDFLDGGSSITKAFVMAMIGTNAACPTVDAVPVVRCKDCKHWKEERKSTTKWLPCIGMATDAKWFCADGKPYCSRCGGDVEIGKDLCDKCMYEAQVEMEEHERMYEPTYNPEDGSM